MEGSEATITKKGNTFKKKKGKDDSKSQRGFVFNLNEGVINWKSFEQETTIYSTIETEYIFESKATKKVVWIRKNYV